jgi:hypothetical protein
MPCHRPSNSAIAVIGIDIGKNSFHVVGHDARSAIELRQKWSRGEVEARLANIPPCLSFRAKVEMGLVRTTDVAHANTTKGLCRNGSTKAHRGHCTGG